MNEGTKKKVMAIELIILLLVSSLVVYINIDKFEDFFSQPETTVSQYDFSKKEGVLDPTTVKVKELIQQLDESMIREHIEKLTSWGPHATARRSGYWLSNRPIIGKFIDLPIEKVARYIYSEFESYGLEVRYQYWDEKPTIKNLREPYRTYEWNAGNNVEATLPGTDKNSDKIYVLVAHYDTMSNAPGANDDSSGVAAILAAARLMSQYSFNNTISFVAVCGEEQGLLGSRAYAEEAAKNNDNIVATLDVEFIGAFCQDYRDKEVLIVGNTQSSWIVNFVRDVNKRYSEFLNLTIFWENIDDTGLLYGHISDYKAFLNQGYDAVVFASSTDPTNMHMPSDTVKNTDIKDATDISRLILATAAELAEINIE